jgi:hypothetical protein
MDWLPDELPLSETGHLGVDDVAVYEERRGFDPSPEIELLRELGLSRGERLTEFDPGPGGLRSLCLPTPRLTPPSPWVAIRTAVELGQGWTAGCYPAGNQGRRPRSTGWA